MRVKRLDWKSVGSGRWRSQGATCSYDIWHQWASDGSFRASVHLSPYTDVMLGGGFKSLDEAQDAIQEDYGKRIISALEVEASEQ
jgi:hypothetical protein